MQFPVVLDIRCRRLSEAVAAIVFESCPGGLGPADLSESRSQLKAACDQEAGFTCPGRAREQRATASVAKVARLGSSHRKGRSGGRAAA